jgi:hypothetical protein
MSRKLDQERSEANALRTLDERRAAQAAREAPNNSARPAPGYEQRDARMPPSQGYGYGNAPAPAQPPIIINNNNGGSGIGHVIAGAIIARSAASAHAHNNGGYYPAPSGSGGNLANQAGANSVVTGTAVSSAPAAPATAREKGGSVFGTIMWLGMLALIAWAVFRLWKRAQARRAAKQPNYSFERN